MTNSLKPIKRKRKNHIPSASKNNKRKRTNVEHSFVKEKKQSLDHVTVKHREKKSNATIMIIRSALWDADLFPDEISRLLEDIAENKKAIFLEKVRDLVTDLIKSDEVAVESGDNQNVAAINESTGEF